MRKLEQFFTILLFLLSFSLSLSAQDHDHDQHGHDAHGHEDQNVEDSNDLPNEGDSEVEFEPSHSYSDDIEAQQAERKKNRFKGYGKYREQFREICLYIVRDGRGEIFFQLLKANDMKGDVCESCKSMFYTWYNSCKIYDLSRLGVRPVFSKKSPTVEPTATPSPTPGPKKQRDPHPRVQEIFIEIFSDICLDKDNLAQHFQALRRLTKALTAEEGRTPAEVDYLSALAAYANAPFEGIAHKYPEDSSGKSSKAKADKDKQLKELFDF